MRDLFEIETDIKELELQMELNALRHNKLLKERYDAKYVEVTWEDAENYFVENPPSYSYGSEQPHAIHCFMMNDKWHFCNKEDIKVHDKEDDEGKEMWIGGYRNRDGYRRGYPIFIERKFVEKFKK